jgi:hypothetical protein
MYVSDSTKYRQSTVPWVTGIVYIDSNGTQNLELIQLLQNLWNQVNG